MRGFSSLSTVPREYNYFQNGLHLLPPPLLLPWFFFLFSLCLYVYFLSFLFQIEWHLFFWQSRWIFHTLKRTNCPPCGTGMYWVWGSSGNGFPNFSPFVNGYDGVINRRKITNAERQPPKAQTPLKMLWKFWVVIPLSKAYHFLWPHRFVGFFCFYFGERWWLTILYFLAFMKKIQRFQPPILVNLLRDYFHSCLCLPIISHIYYDTCNLKFLFIPVTQNLTTPA